MKIIDAHTHFFPIEGDKTAWAKSACETYWGFINGPRPDGKLSLQGFPTIDKFLRDMDAAGIERAIIQGWYWEHNSTCREQNRKIADIIQKHPDRLSAFAAVNPSDGKGSREIVESAQDMGFSGFGELHEAVQKFDIMGDIFAEFAEAAAAIKFPVCLHMTKPEPRQYFGKADTQNDKIIAAIAKFPHNTFILAHWAGGEIFGDGGKIFRESGNIFFDSAATPLLYDTSAWKKACNLFCKNVVFGSDYPLRLYPRKFKTEELITITDEALREVPKCCAEAFFYDNIKKLKI